MRPPLRLAPNYAVGPQNVGSRLMATVTARNALTSAPADSLVTAVVA